MSEITLQEAARRSLVELIGLRQSPDLTLAVAHASLQGPSTRLSEYADLAGITPSSVSRIALRLTEIGLLQRTGKLATGTAGRNALLYAPTPLCEPALMQANTLVVSRIAQVRQTDPSRLEADARRIQQISTETWGAETEGPTGTSSLPPAVTELYLGLRGLIATRYVNRSYGTQLRDALAPH